MILNLSQEFGILNAQRCTGYNLDSCECEGDYMICRWVSFHSIIPSADSTRTRIIFINRHGELEIENRRYNLASWPNLKYVSTITHKYICKNGFCRESFQNSNETTTDPETTKQMLTISTPVMDSSPSTAITDKKINTMSNSRTYSWINHTSHLKTENLLSTSSPPNSSNREDGLLTIASETPSKQDNIMTYEYTQLVTTATEFSSKQANITSSNKFNNDLGTEFAIISSTPKNKWKIAFISCLIIFSVLIICFIIVLIYIYNLLRRRPNNRILRSNPYHPMWQWADTDL